MSIVTKTGDDGTTSLMFGKRVPKTNLRVGVYGAIDELNATLGLARSFLREETLAQALLQIQKELVVVMGELSVLAEDLPRYQEKGFPLVKEVMIQDLENKIQAIEKLGFSFQGWDTPGGSSTTAALHMARTICRRAEREFWKLKEKEENLNSQIAVYLNRLSDWLWLCAQNKNL